MKSMDMNNNKVGINTARSPLQSQSQLQSQSKLMTEEKKIEFQRARIETNSMQQLEVVNMMAKDHY